MIYISGPGTSSDDLCPGVDGRPCPNGNKVQGSVYTYSIDGGAHVGDYCTPCGARKSAQQDS